MYIIVNDALHNTELDDDSRFTYIICTCSSFNPESYLHSPTYKKIYLKSGTTILTRHKYTKTYEIRILVLLSKLHLYHSVAKNIVYVSRIIYSKH